MDYAVCMSKSIDKTDKNFDYTRKGIADIWYWSIFKIKTLI